MADDPMTISVTGTLNYGPGLCEIYGTMSGPADYDQSGGAACDLSSYLTSVIGGVMFGGVLAQAKALVIPTYLNAGVTAAGGFVTFTWDNAATGDASDAAVLANVDDAADLSTYQFFFRAMGTPVTRS